MNRVPRYKSNYEIYLYGIFEKDVAKKILRDGNAKLPLFLYETPKTALKVYPYFQEPVILRFVLDLSKEGFDELSEDTFERMGELNIKKKDEYIAGFCKYKRSYDAKKKVIVYEVLDSEVITDLQRMEMIRN